MKCVIIAVAVAVTILQVASVTVSEGEYTFSLEAVKMLWQALEEAKYREVRGNEGRSSSASQSHMPAVCSDPALPADFIPLCQDPNAEQAFANLENLATMSLTCELCKSAACTGC